MADVADASKGRWTAEIDGDFVVFLIGARPQLRHPIRTFKDLGGLQGMQHMLKKLSAEPEHGLLGFELGFGLIVQYWRSYDHLEAWARAKEEPHLPVWRNYWRRVGNEARSGIWHETFLVRDGQYEAIYANMRPIGLGKAGTLVPVNSGSRSRNRIRSSG